MRKYFLLLLALCNTAQAVQYLPSDIVAKGKLNPSATGQDMNTSGTRWDFWVATLNTNLGAGVTYIDGSGNLAVDTTVSATELSYLNGVTSAIQTQIDGKQATGNYITALTSDVTATGPGSAAATIANDAVTNAKAANMAQSTIKGRAVSAGTGDPTDLTAAQATAILDVMVGDSGAGGTKGLVPAPGIGDATLCLKGSGAYGTCGGSAAATSQSISQTSHGFSVGNWLYYTGSAYAKAKADSDSTAEVLGVVSVVTDANTFTLLHVGEVTGLSALTAGTTYYLSAATAGAITATEPTTSGHVSKPVFVAVSTTAGVVIQSRGVVVGGGSSSGTSSTEWASYTPTLSAGFGTCTNISFKWRRVGDTIWVKGSFTGGTTAASLGSITLPNSYTMDTAKMVLAATTSADSEVVGQLSTNGANQFVSIVASTSTSTSLVYSTRGKAAASMDTPANVNSQFSDNAIFNVNFSFPASGLTNSN